MATVIAAGAEGQLRPGSRHWIPDRCTPEQPHLSTWQTPIPLWQSVGKLHCSLDAEGPWCERKLSAVALLLALDLLPALAQ